DADRVRADGQALAHRKGFGLHFPLETWPADWGKSTIVRDGWRSASPARTSSAASTHSSGTQAMCVITFVRRREPSSARRSAASLRSIAETVSSAVATEGPPGIGTANQPNPCE